MMLFVVLFPIVSALVIALLSRKGERAMGLFTVCSTALTLAVMLLCAFTRSGETVTLPIVGLSFTLDGFRAIYGTVVCFMWFVSAMLSNFRFPSVSGFLLSFYISVVSGIVMLCVCLTSGMLTLPTSAVGWISCFLFAMVVNIGAFVLFQEGTLLVGGGQASILSTLEPIVSMIVGVLVFGESAGMRTLFGAFLVILASILIAITGMKSTK